MRHVSRKPDLTSFPQGERVAPADELQRLDGRVASQMPGKMSAAPAT